MELKNKDILNVKNEDRRIKIQYNLKKKKIMKIFLVLFLMLYAIISIYPFVWSFVVSFVNPNKMPSIGLNPFISDPGWTADNYNSFFQSPLTKEYATKWISNSFMYSFFNATLNCFFNFLAGYALARIKFRGRKLVIWYILVALMVPVQITQVPQLLILMKLGFINAYTPQYVWFIGVLSTGMTSGVLIFMIRQFYLNMSPSVEEAGLLDGLSRFKVFYKISLRSMLPILATQWTMVFIGSWNNFIMFTLWASGNPNRMTIMPAFQILSQTRFGIEGQGRALAATNLTIAPVLLVYMFSLKFQRKVMVSGEK